MTLLLNKNEKPKQGYVRFGALQKKVRVFKVSSKKAQVNLTKPQKNKVDQIDLALSVMCSIARYDQTLTTSEIAQICDCSQTLISEISRKAIKKLQGRAGLKLRPFLEN